MCKIALIEETKGVDKNFQDKEVSLIYINMY